MISHRELVLYRYSEKKNLKYFRHFFVTLHHMSIAHLYFLMPHPKKFLISVYALNLCQSIFTVCLCDICWNECTTFSIFKIKRIFLSTLAVFNWLAYNAVAKPNWIERARLSRDEFCHLFMQHILIQTQKPFRVRLSNRSPKKYKMVPVFSGLRRVLMWLGSNWYSSFS